MIGDETRRLDPRAAARLIYKTADPTPQQVESIRRELARGRLRGDRAGLWTSPRAVADYLAGRTDSPHGAGRGRAEAPVGFLPV
ncbi:MAG TPA: hypothetical protein VF590_03345, partial [Isosphaeraceae bacterium]